MRLLVCYPLKDLETGNGIVYACLKNGYEVEILDSKILPHMLFEKVNRLQGKLDLILCSRTKELREELKKVKSVYPKIKTAIWNTDARKSVEDWGEELISMVKEADYHFSVSEHEAQEWNKYKETIWLPQGIQTERYKKEKLTQEDHEKYDSDICFIGNCNPDIHTSRAKILDTLNNEYGINRFKWRSGLYGREHNKAVQCSKINLSVSAFPEFRNTWSVRIWKIIAVGGVVLEHERPGMKEYFGNKIETYKDEQDAIRKIEHILENYPKYQRQAERLRVQSVKSHSYSSRLEEMLKCMK